MSSRALRRLQQQQLDVSEDVGDGEAAEGEKDDGEEQVPVVKKKNKKKNNAQAGNIFDLLAAEDAQDAEEDLTFYQEKGGDEINDDDERVKENGSYPANAKTKKKKKRNKKGKANSNNNTDELDEIDQTVNEINKISVTTTASEDGENETDYVGGGAAPSQSSVFKRKSILLVDPRNLSIHNEMKKRFGASVVNANNRRRDHHARRYKRTTCLVTPQDNWPPFSKVGISMCQVKSDNNSSTSCTNFQFEHQEIYRNVQFKFYDALESMDHNNIIALLNAHPYHVDSMLQLSEICRMNEDHRMAGELIERSLFVFECAFHTLFNITQGTCRLDYKRAENRPFFLALYRHISYIGDKACYRTALEFCKVLLGLDPVGDPLGVFLMLDYYSLKAEEYHYLVHVFEDFNETRNLQLLPNFAFSVPLAKFQIGNIDEANEMLRHALLTFPSLLVELTEKIGVDTDNQIRSHPFFDPVTYLKQSSPLNQVISLYVGRSHSLWKQPEVLDWLVENAKYIVDNFNNFQHQVATGENRRSTCFRFSPQNVLRHIMTSDIKEAVEKVPIEVRGQSVMTHDPLPPENSVIGYERPERQNLGGEGGNHNMLSLFLQSLMPSYNQAGVQQNPLAAVGDDADVQQQQPQGAHAHMEEGTRNVHTGAQRLMDVMRELISTMTYRNDGLGEDGEVLDENRFQDEDWEE